MYILILFIVFCSKVYSQNYFDFYTPSNILFEDNLMEIEMKYDIGKISEDRFKVKINSTNGSAKIVGENNNHHSSDLWLTQPLLDNFLKIQIDGNFISTEIWFDILDTKRFEIYRTRKKTLVNFNWAKNYIRILNSNITKW